MKYYRLLAIVILLLFLLLCSGCGPQSIYYQNYRLAELTAYPSSTELTMEETCLMETGYDDVYGIQIQLRQTFTVHNPGDDIVVSLIMPVFPPSVNDPQPVLSIDGEPWETWRGAVSKVEEYGEKGTAKEREVWEQKYRDGSVFEKAFPTWPEYEEPLYVPADGPDPDHVFLNDIMKGWAIGYYIKQVEIPAGGSVNVTLDQLIKHVEYVRLLHPDTAIHCTSRTVSVYSSREDVYLSERDMLQKLPDGQHWEADLSQNPEEEFTLRFKKGT